MQQGSERTFPLAEITVFRLVITIPTSITVWISPKHEAEVSYLILSGKSLCISLTDAQYAVSRYVSHQICIQIQAGTNSWNKIIFISFCTNVKIITQRKRDENCPVTINSSF